jgi:hypothetical protein
MPAVEKQTRPQPKPPERVVDLDLGDGEVLLCEFEDGMFSLMVSQDTTLLSADQARELALRFVMLAKTKGWA